MKFVNRKEELKRLRAFQRPSKGGLAVVWGRRRMGKTRLLLEWLKKGKGIYFAAVESAPPIQRKYFALALKQALPQFSNVSHPDWDSFFSHLAHEAKQAKWKGPLIIDELPYLITSSPELPSILQKFVDHEAKQAGLHLVLCGSSQRMMQGAILESSAPLYGRADEILKLRPILVGYMGEALKLKSAREAIESYAVWGGIPRYWELVEKTQTEHLDTIDHLALDPMGPLFDEPNRLLLEETPSAMSLRPCLDAIGLGAHRLSEIAARIGQSATSLSRPLQKLIELDLVQKEIPFGAQEHHSKKTLYKIKDPFLRFWFTVVAPRKSFFSQGTKTARKRWLKGALPQIYSQVWEELCQEALPLLSEKWGEEVFGKGQRFWDRQHCEWDLLSTSETGSIFIIGEAKWTAKPPTSLFIHQTIDALKRKGVPPVPRKPHAKFLYLLFVPEKPKGLSVPKDVKVIDAKELISSLK